MYNISKLSRYEICLLNIYVSKKITKIIIKKILQFLKQLKRIKKKFLPNKLKLFIKTKDNPPIEDEISENIEKK